MKKINNREGTASIGAVLSVVFVCLMSVMVIYASAQPPVWWASRHVIAVDSSNNPLPANDYAAANQGQLKKMATEAYHELQVNLRGGVGDMTAASGTFPGGTGWQLAQLINSWSGTTSGTLVEITGSNTNDYAAINLGQLKHVSRLFYKRLIETGFASYYPWDASPNFPNDYALANLGQVKNMFSFDVTADSDGNGLPDMWELNNFGAMGQSGTALAPSGSGITILQAYQNGVSPIDYYNGVSPTLTIISGNNQTGLPGTLLSSPLIVQVTGASGLPLVNAPVVFGVQDGAGVFTPDDTGTSATSNLLVVRTGANGQAQAYFQQPLDASYTSIVAAVAGDGEVDFTETSTDDNGTAVAPSNVEASIQPDGCVTVTWQDNSDNETGFVIQYNHNGNWVTAGTATPDTTNFQISGTAGISSCDPISVTPQGATGSGSSGTTSALLALPTTSYTTFDLSGPNTSSDVLSMAVGDDNKAAYSFVSGMLSGTDSWGNSLSGVNQITVNKWDSGTTTSDTIGAADASTSVTIQEPANISGLVDEAINTTPDMYLYASGGEYTDGYYFYSGDWIEPAYVLSAPPPSVIVQPNGNAYGTAIQTVYPVGAGSVFPPTFISNAFSWTWTGTNQPKQNLEFTDPELTSSTENLLVNNDEASTFFDQVFGIGPWGDIVLGSSQAGYFGAGIFGVSTGTGGNGNAEYYVGPGSGNFFITSYIHTSSKTAVFYNPNDWVASILVTELPTSVAATGTAFTPVAMNDNGYAIGGPYYWNGNNLLSLGDSTAVGTALNNQNMSIGYDTASGTNVGMLWLLSSSSATPLTMQSVVDASSYKGEIKAVIPTSISGTDANNSVWILASGSVMENTGTGSTLINENLAFHVNAVTPTGTATPPQITLVRVNASITFNNSPQAINSLGIISGVGAITTNTGTGTTVSARKALVLAPFQLEDQQDPANPKVIQPLPPQGAHESDNAYIERQLSDSCIAYIDPNPNGAISPQMPHLVARLPGSMVGKKVKWRLEVQYKRGNGYRDYYVQDFTRPEDHVLIPAADQSGQPQFTAEMDASQDWNIFESQDWQNEISQNGFFGGTAKLYLWIPSQNATPPTDPIITFRIGGKNPDQQIARNYIDSKAGHNFWYAYAIARHETYGRVKDGKKIRFYNQFYTSHQGGPIGDNSVDMGWAAWAKGWPLYNLDRAKYTATTKTHKKGVRYQNGAGGYGEFQLTWGPKHPEDAEGTGANAFLPRKMIWNWKDNIDGGITELQGKLSPAKALRDGLQTAYSQWPDIPNDGALSGLEAIVVTYYNGTMGLPRTDRNVNGKKMQTCWTAEGASLHYYWLFHENSEEYVQEVNAQINAVKP